jgi:hypothetical protein
MHSSSPYCKSVHYSPSLFTYCFLKMYFYYSAVMFLFQDPHHSYQTCVCVCVCVCVTTTLVAIFQRENFFSLSSCTREVQQNSTRSQQIISKYVCP